MCNRTNGRCTCLTDFTGDSCNQCLAGKYGALCGNHCSIGCTKGTCYKDNGTCICMESFTGSNCANCVNGKYGLTCEKTCSNGCINNACNKIDGSCACLPNFTGVVCDQCVKNKYGQACDKTCAPGCDSKGCNKNDGECFVCTTKRIFGFKCDLECSKHCLNQSCHINGDCDLGCATNSYGKRCDDPCPENCAVIEKASACLQISGVCLRGCKDGYEGDICVQVSKQDGAESSGKIARIAGGVAAVVFVALSLIGVWVFVRTRHNRRRTSTDYETTQVRVNDTNDFHLYERLNERPNGNDTSNRRYNNTPTDDIAMTRDNSSHDYQNFAQTI
ncbi:hypothetical protein DPMN_152509 [Dreissena polymorpha]|uniref:Uncharacterized protein n=1 Tax=Dreissena polymorpha TaxID=45954 RepID=A0A9D4J3X5_DREPO|nr:hypothetical protein DPMN_152509 [Dreissena polymorpha]